MVSNMSWLPTPDSVDFFLRFASWRNFGQNFLSLKERNCEIPLIEYRQQLLFSTIMISQITLLFWKNATILCTYHRLAFHNRKNRRHPVQVREDPRLCSDGLHGLSDLHGRSADGRSATHRYYACGCDCDCCDHCDLENWYLDLRPLAWPSEAMAHISINININQLGKVGKYMLRKRVIEIQRRPFPRVSSFHHFSVDGPKNFR